jgi:hypothetical protein
MQGAFRAIARRNHSYGVAAGENDPQHFLLIIANDGTCPTRAFEQAATAYVRRQTNVCIQIV